MWHKYIAPMNLRSWIRNPERRAGGISGIWKAILDSFDIVRCGLVWQVGSGWDFRLGIDPWPGSGHLHLLSGVLVESLHHMGFEFLADVYDEPRISIHG